MRRPIAGGHLRLEHALDREFYDHLVERNETRLEEVNLSAWLKDPQKRSLGEEDPALSAPVEKHWHHEMIGGGHTPNDLPDSMTETIVLLSEWSTATSGSSLPASYYGPSQTVDFSAPWDRIAAALRVRSRQSASSRVITAPWSMRVQPVVPGYGSEQTTHTPPSSRSRNWK